MNGDCFLLGGIWLIFRVMLKVWTFGVILNAGVFDEIKVEYSKMNGNPSFVV